MRAYVLLQGLDLAWQSISDLEYSVRSGQTAISRTYPGGLFDYIRQHPDEVKIFHAAMRAKSHKDNAAIVEAYDFNSFETIADIGGGKGHLLHAILAANEQPRGILFDLPEGLPSAAEINQERVTIVGGDFFKDKLPKADLYVLCNVLHDWSDEDAARILRAVAQSAGSDGRVVIVEGLIEPGAAPSLTKTIDIAMLAALGGRERMEVDFRNVLVSAGFEYRRSIPTASQKFIIEAVPSHSMQ